MELGTIPSEQVVLVSAVLSAFIAYQSRLNGLESSRERERYLNLRLQDGTKVSDTWGITIDNIQIHEDSGFFYRLRKFFTGTLKGESTVVVRYKRAAIPSSFWESELGKTIIDAYPVEVEHLETQEYLDPTVASFRFETVEDGDIAGFFEALLEVEKDFRPDN